MNITNITPQQLRRAADVQERILSLQNELNQILGNSGPSAEVAISGRRKLSAQAIANIRAGARRRWAKAHRGASATAPAAAPRRKMAPAARQRLSALARARWRAVKAAGRSNL
jgi:hypothetical protein